MNLPSHIGYAYPMCNTRKLLITGRMPVAPPDTDACYLLNADEIRFINAEGNHIKVVCPYVPPVANLIIDFQAVKAWVDGAEVPIDTLVGSDPNTSPYTGPYGTLYDPTKITADGYDNEDDYLGYIGTARDRILAGCTIVVQYKVKNDWGASPFIKMGVDHAPPARDTMLNFANHSTVWLSLWAISGVNYITDCEPLTDTGDVNRYAMTVAGSRAELAVNGNASTLFSYIILPEEQPDPYIATMIDTTGDVLQRVEIYDTLPSTDGLVALSE